MEATGGDEEEEEAEEVEDSKQHIYKAVLTQLVIFIEINRSVCLFGCLFV